MTDTTPELPRLALRPREAAKTLSISERTLWSITSPRGSLPCIHIGRSIRFDPRDLLVWIDGQKEAS